MVVMVGREMATRREMRGFGNTGYRCSKHLGTISYSISKEAVYIVSRTRLADLIGIFGSPPPLHPTRDKVPH